MSFTAIDNRLLKVRPRRGGGVSSYFGGDMAAAESAIADVFSAAGISGRAGQMAAIELAADRFSGAGIVSAAGGSVFFSDSLANGFSSQWDRGNAGIWSAESGFVRARYRGSGTAGTQLRLVLPAGVREIFIAFDWKFSWPNGGNGMPKTLKFFGYSSTGVMSNKTFHGDYGGRSINGFQFGQNRTGQNDNAAAARFSGAQISTTPFTIHTSIGSSYSAPTEWTRMQIHVKKNTVAGGADGSSLCVINGVESLRTSGELNRADNDPYFEYLTFGDYTSSETHIDMDLRNVVVSFTGMPS